MNKLKACWNPHPVNPESFFKIFNRPWALSPRLVRLTQKTTRICKPLPEGGLFAVLFRRLFEAAVEGAGLVRILRIAMARRVRAT